MKEQNYFSDIITEAKLTVLGVLQINKIDLLLENLKPNFKIQKVKIINKEKINEINIRLASYYFKEIILIHKNNI